MANKIYTNHTLEEYNKKHGDKNLEKIKKEEVDKKIELLDKKVWWLIDNVYYEVPKNKFFMPILLWWGKLPKVGKIAIASTGAIALTSAVVFPSLAAAGVFNKKTVNVNEAQWINAFKSISDYTAPRDVTIKAETAYELTQSAGEKNTYQNFDLKIKNSNEFCEFKKSDSKAGPYTTVFYCSRVKDGELQMGYKNGETWEFPEEGKGLTVNAMHVPEIAAAIDNYQSFNFVEDHYEGKLKFNINSVIEHDSKIYFVNQKLTKIESYYDSGTTNNRVVSKRTIQFVDYGKTQVEMPD